MITGQFLETDPIGTKDDPNLYLYAGIDPSNTADPAGTCQRTTNADGSTTDLGICGSRALTAGLVQGLLNDPASSLREVEDLAISQGKMIEVAVGTSDLAGNEIDGTRTISYTDGTTAPEIAVILDPFDTVLVSGYDAVTRERVQDRPLSDQETLEHEIGGHVRDRLTGGTVSDEENAIWRENLYRERRGDSFRRVGHGGRVVPRKGN